MGRGIHRGFITHEELNKSLGKRNLSSENLESATAIFTQTSGTVAM